MDQQKIGKFIAQCRKDQGLTQMQLAEKLGITDRAVSKWETGKSMPDVAITLELCDTLKITVNDLLNGEIVSSEQYNQKLEQRTLDLIAENAYLGKRALKLTRLLNLFLFILSAAILAINELLYAYDDPWVLWVLLGLLILDIIALLTNISLTRVYRDVGYFQCPHCGHAHMPGYWTIFFSLCGYFKGRFRCPKCSQKGWHQRIYTKPEDPQP